MKGVFLFNDWLVDVCEGATDEDTREIGTLILAIYGYTQKGIEPKELTRANKIAFSSFRRNYDEYKEKYEAKCELNRANGHKGGRPPKTQKNRTVIDENRTVIDENPKKPKNKNKDKNKYNKNSPTKVVEEKEKEKENFPPPPQSAEPLKGFENIEVVGATATPAPTAPPPAVDDAQRFEVASRLKREIELKATTELHEIAQSVGTDGITFAKEMLSLLQIMLTAREPLQEFTMKHLIFGTKKHLNGRTDAQRRADAETEWRNDMLLGAIDNARRVAGAKAEQSPPNQATPF